MNFGAESQGFFFVKEKDTFGPLSPSFTTEVCQKPAANRQKEALARLASLIDCTAAKEPSEELGQKGRRCRVGNRTIFKGAQLGCQNFATK